MKKISFIFILIIIIVSCRNSEFNKTQKIKSIENLKSQNIIFKKNDLKIFLGRPSKIFKENNRIHIIDLYEDKTVTVYNCEFDSLVGRFFNIGQGPNDTSWPIQLSTTSKVYSIFERQTGRYREYNFEDIVSNKLYSLIRELKFEMSDQLIKTNFGFICTGMFEPGLINLYDESGAFMNNFDPFDGGLNMITEVSHRFIVGQGAMSYNKKDNSFIYATYFTGDIFVYEYSNKYLFERRHIIIGKEIIKEDQSHYEISKGYLYHTLDVGSSNNYHYVLYSGNPIKNNLKKYLLKINLDGNIETCYQIDEQIERFYVADDDSHIIGIIINEDGEYEIHKAEL